MADTENKNDFQAITTQEALDKIIESRLARERAKYSGYDTFKAKAEKLKETEGLLATTKQELNTALGVVEDLKKASELSELKTAVAREAGVPADMLRGASEDELKAHAEQIKTWAASQKVAPVVPSQGAEPTGEVSDAVQAVRRLFGKQ